MDSTGKCPLPPSPRPPGSTSRRDAAAPGLRCPTRRSSGLFPFFFFFFFFFSLFFPFPFLLPGLPAGELVPSLLLVVGFRFVGSLSARFIGEVGCEVLGSSNGQRLEGENSAHSPSPNSRPGSSARSLTPPKEGRSRNRSGTKGCSP